MSSPIEVVVLYFTVTWSPIFLSSQLSICMTFCDSVSTAQRPSLNVITLPLSVISGFIHGANGIENANARAINARRKASPSLIFIAEYVTIIALLKIEVIVLAVWLSVYDFLRFARPCDPKRASANVYSSWAFSIRITVTQRSNMVMYHIIDGHVSTGAL